MVSEHQKIHLKDTIRLYKDQSLFCRIYLHFRLIFLPIDKLESHVPLNGTILDLGCGYGFLSNYIAMKCPNRKIFGIDLASERIAVARTVSKNLLNVRFDVEDLNHLNAKDMNCILLIDTLHYFTESEQESIFLQCRKILISGGILIFRETVKEFTFKFLWNWIHESLMVGTMFTTIKNKKLHFLTLKRILKLIQSAGFEIISVNRLRPFLPYTDTLVIAKVL